MLLADERQQIVDYGKKLINSQLTTGSGGNLSIINRNQGLVAIKPSGVDYFKMTPEDIVVVDAQGKRVEGDLKPSSEISFHLALLNNRQDINAVLHTHQIYATTVACLNWELPAVHYLIGYSGNKVPLAPYATFGSKELADNIVQSIGQYNACLMANHGIVTVGPDMFSAFNTAEELELVSRIYLLAKSAGEPAILSDDEMKIIVEKFKTYGQKK